MKFRNLNNTLIAACEEASEFLNYVVDECELFSTESLRTMAQNAKMWPMLSDISKQVVWIGQKHDAETWKHIITAAWRAQVFVQGIGGNLVVIPAKTSRLGKKPFSELIEAIYSFGSDEGVKWSEPALAAYQEYSEAGR